MDLSEILAVVVGVVAAVIGIVLLGYCFSSDSDIEILEDTDERGI